MGNYLKVAITHSISALFKRGWSQRRRGRELGVDRKTVGRHIARDGVIPSQNQPFRPPGTGVNQAGVSLTGSRLSGSLPSISAICVPAWGVLTGRLHLASCQFIRQARDVLFGGREVAFAQALGYQAIKAGFLVLYRSVFDTVRELLQDEAFAGETNALRRYLRPDLLIIDDMGLKHLPHKAGEWLFEIEIHC